MAHTGWVIVEFISDESVSEIPSDWVVGGFCYWPPYKPSRITLAIKNCQLCDESWEKLAVAVFPGGICYDYATARAKARKAEQTSDLQSDVETTKRKIIPKRYSSSEESGPERTPLMSPLAQIEDFSRQRTQLLPPPPKMRKTVIRSGVKICYIKIIISEAI
ncbi:uncharacterized protein LOC143377608 [Andrena cerasifolii]|uniref:uncharacterized protein LOC143377608 n=1 Tax=Andrena cerasifolii TaxID=2819439 RepID=UPI0040383DF5